MYNCHPYGGKSGHALFTIRSQQQFPHKFTETEIPCQGTRVVPKKLRLLLQRCWDNDPTRRPTASYASRVLAPHPAYDWLRDVTALVAQDGTALGSGTLLIRWLERSVSLSQPEPTEEFFEALCWAARDASLSIISFIFRVCCNMKDAVTASKANKALYDLIAASGARRELDTDRVEIIRLLLEAGANPRLPNLASTRQFDGTLQLPPLYRPGPGLVLPSIVPLQSITTDQSFLLCIAIYHSDITLITALLDHLDEDTISKADFGYAPLIIAATRPQSTSLVSLLLRRGASPHGVVHYTSTDGPAVTYSPLAIAVYHAHRDAVYALLSAGAHANGMDDHTSLLSWAASRSDRFPSLIRLLEYGADPNYGGLRNHCLPLHGALSSNNTAAIDLLLKRGADPSLSNNSGKHSLFFVTNIRDLNEMVTSSHTPIALDQQESVDGDTPLHEAALRHHHDVIACLLELGARATIKRRDGRTALHVLCAQYYYGSTLHSMNNFIATIRKLIRHGVGIEVVDNRGMTALDVLQKANVASSYAPPIDAIALLTPRR